MLGRFLKWARYACAPTYERKGSNVYSLLSSHLISQLEKHLLEFSWEEAFLQLEIENESELVAASLVAYH